MPQLQQTCKKKKIIKNVAIEAILGGLWHLEKLHNAVSPDAKKRKKISGNMTKLFVSLGRVFKRTLMRLKRDTKRQKSVFTTKRTKV